MKLCRAAYLIRTIQDRDVRLKEIGGIELQAIAIECRYNRIGDASDRDQSINALPHRINVNILIEIGGANRIARITSDFNAVRKNKTPAIDNDRTIQASPPSLNRRRRKQISKGETGPDPPLGIDGEGVSKT